MEMERKGKERKGVEKEKGKGMEIERGSLHYWLQGFRRPYKG